MMTVSFLVSKYMELNVSLRDFDFKLDLKTSTTKNRKISCVMKSGWGMSPDII